MREILFRGKEKGSGGAWVFGDLFHSKKPDLVFISNYDNDDYKEYNVIPETVGQYTGLEDRHGAKIIEGDIVEYKDEYGQITYHESEAMFMIEFDTWLTDFDHITNNDIEKVGNIHDDPELLEGA